MKKKVVVLCIAVTLMLTACGTKEEVQEPVEDVVVETESDVEDESVIETEEEETETEELTEEEKVSDFAKGILTDEGWESEWLGMRFVPEDTMNMSTEEELNDLMGISMDMLSEDFNELQIQYAELNTVYEMMCTADDNASNVNMTLEKLPMKIDVDTYVELFLAQVSEVSVMAMNVVNEGEDVTVAGRDFKKLQCEVSYEGVTLYQDYYMAIIEDRVQIIVVSYLDEAEAESLMSCFQVY